MSCTHVPSDQIPELFPLLKKRRCNRGLPAKETNWNSPVKFAPYLFSRGNVSLFRLRPPVRRRPLTVAISHVALLIQIAAFKRRACVSSCP